MRAIIAGLVLAAVGAIVVQPLPPFMAFVAGQLAVLIIVAVGLSFLIGVGGLLSIASAAFLGIGAYGLAITTGRFELPFLLAVPLTVVIAWIAGYALGLVSLRLTGFHLAIVTLGFLEVFLIVLRQGGNFTGGGYGLGVPTPEVFGAVLSEEILIGFAAATAVLTCTFTYTAIKSRVGRALYGLKSHASAAALQGVDARRLKTLAFAYSSALAALAGCLQAALLGSTHPASYTANEAVWHLAIVTVGGLQGSVIGAALAATLLFILPEVMRPLAEWREFFTGGVLLLTLIIYPGGLGDAINRARQAVGARSRPAKVTP